MTTLRREKSTIVRAYRPLGHALVRAAVRTVDSASPALAARFAARIWCTPPKPSRRAVALAAAAGPPPGTRFTASLHGTTVVAEAWGDGPVTYLLHGWGGWRGQLTGLVEPLVRAGQRVVALDAPGHGESGPGRPRGRRTTLVEVAEALAAVVAVAGPAHAVVGHSGGANAAAVAVRGGLAADRLVFLAPMADPLPYLDPFSDLLGLGERARGLLVRRLEHLVGRSFADFDVPGWAARAAPDELPRLLVVHDRGDREIHYADGRAIADAWPGATLRTTENLGHRRIVAAPEVVDATVTFLTTRLLTATAAASTGRS